MRLLADLHISPRTVQHLRQLGYDVVRVPELLPATSTDAAVVQCARREGRSILTQDLDYSALIALAGETQPSLISLRLRTSRIEHVNEVLEKLLPSLNADLQAGTIITVSEHRIRRRRLPLR